MPPAPPVQHSSGNPLRIILILATVIILVGIAVWFWPSETSQPSQQGTATFLLRSADGTSGWYELSGATLRQLAPQTALATTTIGTVTIVESSQGLPVGTPVLVSVENRSGTRFGLLRSDGTFASLTGSGIERRGLSVRPDGLAAFSYVDETSQSAAALSAWRVGVVDVIGQSVDLKDLGVGYAPTFATNGNILALAPEGFVEIHAGTGAHTTLLSTKTDFPLTFIVGPGGSFVVIKNDVTGTSDVFWVNSAKPSDMSYLGSLASTPIALGIVGPNSFVAKTSSTEATLYSVSRSGMIAERTLTIAP